MNKQASILWEMIKSSLFAFCFATIAIGTLSELLFGLIAIIAYLFGPNAPVYLMTGVLCLVIGGSIVGLIRNCYLDAKRTVELREIKDTVSNWKHSWDSSDEYETEMEEK